MKHSRTRITKKVGHWLLEKRLSHTVTCTISPWEILQRYPTS
jgi:hypothetical protein